jgi:BMFP domain-containing protein YqiC
MPYGRKNLRRSSINQHAPFRERFTRLLEQELRALREIESLQSEALACLNQGAFSGLMDLVQKQENVQAQMAKAREELAPLLKRFESFSADEKSAIRQAGVGALLDAIERVATSIQGRHQGAFPETAAPMRPQDGENPSTENPPAGHDDDLQNRIARFRT